MTRKKYNHDQKTEAFGKYECQVIIIVDTKWKGQRKGPKAG